jgi:hypothetical protein
MQVEKFRSGRKGGRISLGPEEKVENKFGRKKMLDWRSEDFWQEITGRRRRG